MGTRRCIDELDGEAQLGPRLAQAAFHHIARTEFLACGPYVHCLPGIARSGAPGDDAKIGESRQAGDDVLGEPFGQRCEFGVSAAVLEWKHSNPESFLGANRSRLFRCHCTRRRCRSQLLRRMLRQIAKLVADVACRLHSVTRVLFQAAPDDAGQIARQIGTNVGDGRCRIPQNRGDQLGGRISIEGPLSRRHLMEHDAQRKNVGAMVEGAARSLFRRHVGWRPHHHTHLRLASRG